MGIGKWQLRVHSKRSDRKKVAKARKLNPLRKRWFFSFGANLRYLPTPEIFNHTKIDRWFLVQIKEIVDFEEELAGAKN